MNVPEYLEKTVIKLYNVWKKYVFIDDDLPGSLLVKICVNHKSVLRLLIYQRYWYLNRWSEERAFDGIIIYMFSFKRKICVWSYGKVWQEKEGTERIASESECWQEKRDASLERGRVGSVLMLRLIRMVKSLVE